MVKSLFESPTLIWDAMFNMKKVKLELISDNDINTMSMKTV